MRTIYTACLCCVATAASAAECPPQTAATAEAIAEGWRARSPIAAPIVADAAAALCVQDAFVARLATQAGERFGWKVGLTSPAAQETFGVDHPVAGQLLDGMVVIDGATVSRRFGARGIAEADLLVKVRDAEIMQATTPLEALAHLESFVPFIELADLLVAPGAPLDADIISAINVGARAGVTGTPVRMEATQEWLTALGTMTVVIEDGQGAILGEFPGAAILGHPLNAVLWLIEDLTARGETLEPGDHISLGSFGPPLPAGDLDVLRVRYDGLPVDPAPLVGVRFE